MKVHELLGKASLSMQATVEIILSEPETYVSSTDSVIELNSIPGMPGRSKDDKLLGATVTEWRMKDKKLSIWCTNKYRKPESLALGGNYYRV